MGRPKKTASDNTATEPTTPAQALDTAMREFKKLPSLGNWSKVETVANAYRNAWLSALDAVPVTANGHSEN